MLVELSRFRIKPGKESRVDEWIAMLNARMAEARETLAREKTKVEVIFRERIGVDEYLYWFSIHDDAAPAAQSQPSAVDREHLAFHNECLDHDYGRRDAQTQVVIVPDDVAASLAWPEPERCAVPWRSREIVYRRRR